MNRRNFVSTMGLSALLAGRSALASAPGSARSALGRASAGGTEFDPVERSIADLQMAQARGLATAESLTGSYLQRIELYNRQGPMLGAVLAVNPNALSAARALDRERAAGKLRGPLHGIPILLKDNIETGDPLLPTTAGSLALIYATHSQDSPVAARLRAAGAVVLGKANLSEWANFRSTHSTSGWSGVGGQTRSPYHMSRNPSGSSAGPAVATSANLCAAALGTETDGSILAPASINGVVGLKPTHGLVSSTGIVPISSRQDTAGPITRSVDDAAVLLSVMAERERSWRGIALPLEPAPRGLKLGVMAPAPSTLPKVERQWQEWLKLLQWESFTLVHVPTPRAWTQSGNSAPSPEPSGLWDVEVEVLLSDFKADINAYLARLEGNKDVTVRTLADLIEFNREHAEREMPYFGQDYFLQAEAAVPRGSAAYQKALARLVDLADTEGLAALFNQYGVDALVAPGNGPADLIDHILGDRHESSVGWPAMCSAAAIAGYPSLTVPAGMVDGLPVGIAFVAPRFGEDVLLRVGRRFELAMEGRRPPVLS
ncbi:MAG: amidase family protein [Steroidobacteraceae bacterium]